MLLAGLITSQHITSNSGLPGIVQVEVLRDLLAGHDNTGTRTELIIFIKPQIIRNAFDAEEVSEEFRDRMALMQARSVTKPQ